MGLFSSSKSSSTTNLSQQTTTIAPTLAGIEDSVAFGNVGDAMYIQTDHGAINKALDESYAYAGHVADLQGKTVEGVLGLGTDLISWTSNLITSEGDRAAKSQSQAVQAVGDAYAASVQGGIDTQKLFQIAIIGAVAIGAIIAFRN